MCKQAVKVSIQCHDDPVFTLSGCKNICIRCCTETDLADMDCVDASLS